jgi:hypothetical protein
MQARQPQAWSEEALLAAAFTGRLADTATQLCACSPIVLDLSDVQVLSGSFSGVGRPSNVHGNVETAPTSLNRIELGNASAKSSHCYEINSDYERCRYCRCLRAGADTTPLQC